MNKREDSNVLRLTLETLLTTTTTTTTKIQIYKEKSTLKNCKTPQNDIVKMSLWLEKLEKNIQWYV